MLKLCVQVPTANSYIKKEANSYINLPQKCAYRLAFQFFSQKKLQLLYITTLSQSHMKIENIVIVCICKQKYYIRKNQNTNEMEKLKMKDIN